MHKTTHIYSVFTCFFAYKQEEYAENGSFSNYFPV